MPLEPLPASVHTRRQAIGARIRTARLAANLTQEKLGELVGADHKTIHRIEYGTSDPSLTLLLLLADALRMPLSELVAD